MKIIRLRPPKFFRLCEKGIEVKVIKPSTVLYLFCYDAIHTLFTSNWQSALFQYFVGIALQQNTDFTPINHNLSRVLLASKSEAHYLSNATVQFFIILEVYMEDFGICIV